VPRALIRAAVLLGSFTALAVPEAGLAQHVRPGDVRPPLPEPAPAPPAPALDLPPLPPPAPEAEGALAAGLRVRVERFEITGSTVFSEDELAGSVAPWTGRFLDSEELLSARDAVTRLYVERGFVNSGAVIPDQDVAGGVVRLEVVEGRLTHVEVEGNDHFRAVYFESRLLRAGSAPLALDRIERALRRLQRDPLIERVDASLEPGEQLGEGVLRLRVTEGRRYHLALGSANDNSPAVGEFGGSVEGAFANLAGIGDVWFARGEFTEGLIDVETRLEVPVTPWDTRLLFSFRDTQSEIVEEPFDDLDIEASTRSYGIGIGQPVWRREADEVWLSVLGERRESEASVLGLDFCFEVPTPGCADPVVTVLRFAAEWTRRTRSDVVAARSQLSVGIDALGATVLGDSDLPDGEFVAWLGQLQWAHVLPERLLGSQIVARLDAQLANDPLLSIEKFAVGGLYSVRGYRENQLVRDDAVVASLELRVPVWRDPLGRHLLQIVPFTDFGHGWNVTGPEVPSQRTLWSLGAGLRATPRDWIRAELWWGGRLFSVPNPHDALQDYGVSFRVSVDVL
jgi:hemolysin activation/secretion protein